MSEDRTPTPVPSGRFAVPQELYKALSDCVSAFQECSRELRQAQQDLRELKTTVNARLDDIRGSVRRLDGKVTACDAGVKGLSEQVDNDYSTLRDLSLKHAAQLDGFATRITGTHHLAASAYDMIESLSRRLRDGNILPEDEARSASAPTG